VSTLPDEPRWLERSARWSLPTRIVFRFCVLYFGLYVVLTQMLTTLFFVPGVDLPDVAMLPPLSTAVTWVAKHVFGVTSELVIRGSGSGDKTYDWVLVFCLLVLAAAGTIVWSVLDRRRPSYVLLHGWFRVLLRFAVGSTLLSYGVIKVVPLQMPYPSLIRLVEPYGDLSPMGVLWASLGASPAYQAFTGCAETLAGILLLLPRTTLLGALIALADAIQVFALNMTYDVPVKLFSFHLILMAVFLIAPATRRLLHARPDRRSFHAAAALPVEARQPRRPDRPGRFRAVSPRRQLLQRAPELVRIRRRRSPLAPLWNLGRRGDGERRDLAASALERRRTLAAGDLPVTAGRGVPAHGRLIRPLLGGH
jgi:uncharacterized membrane protein YphA (DoxX/SURF4 family)